MNSKSHCLAEKSLQILLVSCFFVSFSVATSTDVIAAVKAGKVVRLIGDVRAQTEGEFYRVLKKNDIIYSGDEIKTSDKSIVSVRFSDLSLFTLGPNSTSLIDEYQRNDTKKKKSSFQTRILKGSFRFISGLIAKNKRKSMRVRVRVATIGIRGTHFSGEVTERKVAADGEIIEASAKVVLLEPEEKGKKTSIEVSNDFGSVVVDEPGYGTEIPDEHSPPSHVRKMQLRTISNVLRSLQSITRNKPKIR